MNAMSNFGGARKC